MQTPLQVTFRGMPKSSTLATQIQTRVAKLEQMFDRITSCHVVIEIDGHHHSHGDRYRVSVHIGLPGHDLAVTHVPSGAHDAENAHATADRAFDDAERQLRDWIKRQHDHHPKGHPPDVAGRPAN